MPFPFTLPTTAHVSFTDFFTSSTHPSLPLAATSARGVLRDALKRHKRLPTPAQPSHLPTVLSALQAYLPYLFALDAGLSGQPVSDEEIDVVLVKEVDVEWRPTLSDSALPGRREPPRAKLRSLESELACALGALAGVHCLLARAQLHRLYDQAAPLPGGAEQRGAAIAGAMRHYLQAHAVYAYLAERMGPLSAAVVVPDVAPAVLRALAEVALAEATLIAVLKDDPYPAAVVEERSRTSTDWMFKNPEIPKVRAHLFARLCLAAADHAAKAQGMLRGVPRLDERLAQYADDLRRAARGKACRFLAIDAELSGKTGEGIAWLRGAKKELGLVDEAKLAKGFAKLRMDWAEKREDKRIEKGGSWGSDAGKFEEGRIVEMLERKWVKTNDTIGVQLVPPCEPLLASMPSGREYHTPRPYAIPHLDADEVARMRAPPDPSDRGFVGDEDDSNDEEEAQKRSAPAGAFPGTHGEYPPTGTAYY